MVPWDALGIINVGNQVRICVYGQMDGLFLPAATGASPRSRGQSAFDDAQEQGDVGGCLIYESLVVLPGALSLLGAEI